MESALYVGKLRHRRFSPKRHEFTYPVFMALLDIDDLPHLMRSTRFAAYNRWNWSSYFERDHFGDPAKPLRERLLADASAQGISFPPGKIFLLTHLRYLGYVFNPVSFFYFYDRSGSLRQMMAEVNSTFGESHNYWLTPEKARPSTAAVRYATAKSLHVSPFMGMDLAYDWIFTPPGDRLVAHMNTLAHAKPFFDATLELRRRPWSSRELRGVLLAFPLMTLRVIAAIHWEALRLWLKRVPVFPYSGKARRSVPAGPHASISSSEGDTHI